jgi:hypothetical protein
MGAPVFSVCRARAAVSGQLTPGAGEKSRWDLGKITIKAKFSLTLHRPETFSLVAQASGLWKDEDSQKITSQAGSLCH